MRTIIDPSPAGWAYGFPREYTNTDTNLSAMDWCVKQGYPEELAKNAVLRFWESDIDN